MTYAVLSVVFLALACMVAAAAIARVSAARRRALCRRWSLPAAITAAALIVLTAVFDNLMIALGFMVYSEAHVTGLSVGLAPLEDFSYPLAGLLLLPALWSLLSPRESRETHD